MIFIELKLHNFGVYVGQQAFDMEPGDENNRITLVGALNGSGKTTFLTAIQLVLYGPLAPAIKSTKGAYKDFLRSKINRTIDPGEGAIIQLMFKAYDDDGERRQRGRFDDDEDDDDDGTRVAAETVSIGV